MKEQIAQIVGVAVAELCESMGADESVGVGVVQIERPRDNTHGDWTTNVAFRLAGVLRKSPQEIATTLVEKLRSMIDEAQMGVSVESNYINFTLTFKAHQDMLVQIIASGDKWGASEIGVGQSVLVEYVSANPTGPLHLGNARGGPYGDTLSAVLAKSGYSVAREYYVNDYGNQITVLGHSIIGDDEAQYSGDYIQDLRSKLIAQNEEGIDIQDAQKVGRVAAQEIVREIIAPSLARAGIEFDSFFSEKSLHDSGAVDEVVEKLRKLDFVYEKDGAMFFASTKVEGINDDKDRVLVTADGRKTYFCADIAYHLDKLSRADRLINIWGADHGGTVARLQGALSVLGHSDKLDIILTQFVRVMEDGKEVKMSKRRGTYIALIDLIDEVGADVTRFIFLMQAATTHVVFDLDVAREKSDKNPVYYVQYAHARMASILRKAESEKEFAQNESNSENANLSPLIHAKEIALIRILSEFPEIITRTADDYSVHRLAHYAISLADSFHSFYGACKVIDTKNIAQTTARLELVRATKTVLAEALRIVGVSVPEKM